ncbi:AAA family ATPase [Desulfococcaceae bacterium HSG8]|nr:AAA family ATPase [Desulfococcaceae bacterium HSG8]
MKKNKDEKLPSPKEIEKEIGEFLAKKFGGEVKVLSPINLPQEVFLEAAKEPLGKKKKIKFNLKPEELVAYLDQYIVKQDAAKAVLSTKICTHFNRIKRAQEYPEEADNLVGRIKNNVLMIGPTGVGKTYMVKLIAKKIGVPFVKGDATKFSETGYVGGDVEDLVRDLVREADGDIDLAQNGIIYVDEIDKIASSRHLVGADISRTGVQRALLKPMEETEIELKVPHDPISMIQEIERFRKTGQRDRNTVNTKNILFIVSGAFADISEIIDKRIRKQGMGFGAQLKNSQEQSDILRNVKSEDLIEFGFESEFVGRLPVHAVFERLTEDDLTDILKNPNNPVILGKKLDFAAYGIRAKFEENVLRILAQNAFKENTGARGLVSAIEKALLLFEKSLPSTNTRVFPVTKAVFTEPEDYLEMFTGSQDHPTLASEIERLADDEKEFIREYVNTNKKNLAEKYNLTLSPYRIDAIAGYYCEHIMEIGDVISRIKFYADEIKKIELYFYKNHDINIVMEEEAIDFIIEQFINASAVDLDDVYKKLTDDFEYGLKLVREKTGRNRFFITRNALVAPEEFIGNMLRDELGSGS